MNSISTLNSSTTEFGRLEYQLQLSLKAATARIKNAATVSNPHLQLQFDKRTKQNTLILDCWISLDQLFPRNSAAAIGEDEAIRRLSQMNSIQLPSETGMLFTAGRLDAPQIRNCLVGSSSTVYKMIFCKIAVGRSLAMPSESEAAKAIIPDGYDSFILFNQQQPRKNSEQQQYLIKNGSQVLPVYFVQFEYDADLESRSRQQPRCDNCESALAEVHCPADSANLCRACDSKLHSASKIAQRHRRNPIKRAVDALGCCRHHELQKIEFYCPQCSLAVCVHCKMVGHHSTPETANHRLVSVSEAFDTIMTESKADDPILNSRKSKISSQIQMVQNRAQLVQDEHNKIKRQLDNIYQQSIEKLKYYTNEKMLILLSDEVELGRQQQEIRLVEEFLDYQQTAADAYPLLLNWHKHQQVQQELREFRSFRENIDVELDLAVSGDLTVVQSIHTASGLPKQRAVDKINAENNLSAQEKFTHYNINQRQQHPTKKTWLAARRTSEVFSEVLNVENVSLVNDISQTERNFASDAKC